MLFLSQDQEVDEIKEESEEEDDGEVMEVDESSSTLRGNVNDSTISFYLKCLSHSHGELLKRCVILATGLIVIYNLCWYFLHCIML